jgi:hypothetical protein
MKSPKTKRQQFKTAEEFLGQLDADVARWIAYLGDANTDRDRLYATGFDQMFKLFGHPFRIGDASPYPTLLRLHEEAMAAKQQSRVLLLAECLRMIRTRSGSRCR